MSERDVRVVETMAATGMGLDDLCDVFAQFFYEDIEVIYRRLKREVVRSVQRESSARS